MTKIFFLTLLLSLTCIVYARLRTEKVPVPLENTHVKDVLKFNQYQYWFSGQLVNHFTPTDNRTFSQRYWVVPDYYDPRSGPVFMYICGEYTCDGVMQERLFPVMVASQQKALIVVLEHRYYGLSQPLGNDSLKTSNLVYLTVEQALADLAYFINWVKQNNTNYKIGANSKWISLGGSYPGALSAWLRLKYPNLVVGSLASSPVIYDILNFPEFDYQIYLSANKSGSRCPATVQNLTKYVENNLYNNGSKWAQQFKSQFGNEAQQLSNEEFLWYFADTIAETIQYGGRTALCSMFAKYDKFNDLWNATVQFINQNGDPTDYGSYFIRNSTWNPSNEGARQWNYQCCSQLGWFQGPATNSQYAMRSSRVNLAFYKQFCQESFGISLWPNTNLTNNRYGGKNIKSTNTVLVNGCEDPWLWASNINSSNPAVSSYYIDCHNCAHCVELYTPAASDSLALQQARINIVNNITSWLKSSISEGIVY